MKPFNLEEYLKNPSLKIVTREGKDARIICTDAKGKYVIHTQHPDDLFFASEKKERWINLYYNKVKNQVYFGKIFKTEEKAKKIGKSQNNYVITIPIEWED